VKLGIIPENLLERLLLAIKIVPTPIFDTQIAFMLARTIMAGTKLGIFEALAAGPLSAAEVAAHCKTDSYATIKLLNALVGAGYLRIKKERYFLKPVAQKWLLKDSPRSIYDKMMFHFTEWEWTANYEAYVRTGKPLIIHDILSEETWGVYQRGMRSLVALQAREVIWRMLDIGGSHGYFSVAFCRRYPTLRAVVLDLPEAVKHAAPLLAKEGMGARVVHRVGNAITDDLGTDAWDLVFISQFVHHFDDATNRDLVRRAGRALRPGGFLVIQDVLSPSVGNKKEVALLADLYIASTSQSGSWSLESTADWQRAAGLIPRKAIRFRSLPGFGQQAAMKPAA
jgi:SAM-dependent methyltransferase